jgi:hypothetical protein
MRAFAIIALCGLAAMAADKVKLEIEYPRPLVKGTEVPKSIPNMEASRPEGSAPPAFMVPEGCENLAADMYVTSSDDDPVAGDLDMITDEDADGQEFVQLRSGLQWIQIDLEDAHELHAVHIWHYHAQPRVYFDIIVEISDDPDFIEGVTTVFNNDHDNSAGKGSGSDKHYIEEFYGRTIDAKGTKGQYVRIYSKGSSGDKANHYIEVQVFGK